MCLHPTCGFLKLRLLMRKSSTACSAFKWGHSSEDYRDDYKKFVRIESSGDANFFVPTLTATVCTIDVMP
ncbi:hypothetical protein OESDEN_00739 [Oesophagostomum dentatum]|uniref:Uncharacterized protein n=1 Tax=Oesophagostomum dentatum TaxID=61180 RepID=A0A0B1TV06_OESDE|nr:hypothetical protein OESDEN_00739 [Oesophagostomum dentatum]